MASGSPAQGLRGRSGSLGAGGCARVPELRGDARVRKLLVVCISLASGMATLWGAPVSSAVDDRHPASQAGPGPVSRAVAARTQDAVPSFSLRGLPPVNAPAAVAASARVLVMRIYWSESPPRSPDQATMRGLMKDTAAWFKRVSRGRHHVTSRVLPWLKVGGGDSNCSDLELPLERALAAAQKSGFGTDGYDRFMVVSPECASTSFAELPGRVTWIREAQPYLAVLVHELGHNLGLNHANSSICSRHHHRVTEGGSCSNQEYGDMWDAMGLSDRPYSVPQLQSLGWAGRVATAERSGTWTLRDAEDPGRGFQALRVRSGKVSYWLEYHTNPVALAESTATFEIRGIPGLQIRLDTGGRSLRILDAAPGNPNDYLTFPDPDFVNVALPLGSTFTTPQGVRITLKAQGATKATVRITRGH